MSFDQNCPPIFIASGVRIPFDKVGGSLAAYDALSLSTPLAKAMVARLGGRQS